MDQDFGRAQGQDKPGIRDEWPDFRRTGVHVLARDEVRSAVTRWRAACALLGSE